MNLPKCYSFFRLILILILTMIICYCSVSDKNNLIIESPVETIKVKLMIDEITGKLSYQANSVTHQTALLEKSSLGFEIENDQFESELEIISIDDYAVKKVQYELLTGKKRKINSEFTEAKFYVKNPNGQKEMAMKFVVIGGDAAGMSAASRAKRKQPDMEVTVLEKTSDVSYSA